MSNHRTSVCVPRVGQGRRPSRWTLVIKGLYNLLITVRYHQTVNMEWINWLNSPELVAKFQKYCGVEYRRTQQPLVNGAAGDNIGITDISKIAGNLRSRNVNSFEQNSSTIVRNDSQNELSSEYSERSSDSSDENIAEEGDYVCKSKSLYYLFCFGASLGNEIFYIMFFPYWFWNMDGYVGRRVCAFWSIFMYFGQAAKDIIRWPRPASPPVIRLEKRYALEYGMPSTHAMVGAGVPFSILYFCLNRYEFHFWTGLVICLVWCTVVCCSRLYLGMHSVLDIIAGLVFVTALMPVGFPLLNIIDHYALHSPYAPIFCMGIPLLMGFCYPSLDKWSTARGDTGITLGVSAGVMVGHWIAFQTGFMQKAVTMPPYQIIMPSWTWFGQMLMRFSLGVVVVMSTRAFMKLFCLKTACLLLGIDESDMKARRQVAVEMPSKFFTYAVIAINTVYTSPYLFRIVGVERITCFTEI